MTAVAAPISGTLGGFAVVAVETRGLHSDAVSAKRSEFDQQILRKPIKTHLETFWEASFPGQL